MEEEPLMNKNERHLHDESRLSEISSNEDVEMPEDHKLRQRSMRVIYLISFFGAIAYTITMPSLWPYMKKLDQLVKPWYLGIANGGYNLGHLIGVFTFSAWHRTYGARAPLLACILIKFSGDCLHVLAAAFPGSNGLAMLIAARFVTGLSNGQAVVCRTVLAHSSTLKEKKIIFASLFTVYAFGYAVGPGLQAVLAFILKKEYRHSFIILDAFNAPGWLGMVLQIISFSSVLILFKEYNLTSDNETKTG
ncbi:major facilitator superfamily domain-containing protein 8-like [Rhopilema esculentum]|uniref:major facilitator superfamily domain-containing protein 8-like n=1 Tax=Rhopilema esculentum TaxID=499914 RepID=UPI0031D806AA